MEEILDAMASAAHVNGLGVLAYPDERKPAMRPILRAALEAAGYEHRNSPATEADAYQLMATLARAAYAEAPTD